VEDGQAAPAAAEAVELPRMVEEIVAALADQHPNDARPDVRLASADWSGVHTDEQKLTKPFDLDHLLQYVDYLIDPVGCPLPAE